MAPRNNAERAKLQEEIAELKLQLAQAKASAGGNANMHALEDEVHSLMEDKETVGFQTNPHKHNVLMLDAAHSVVEENAG